MTDPIYILIIYLVLPCIIGAIGYLMKTVTERLRSLEIGVQERVNEDKVRQIVMDKLDPLREDIHEIREDVHSLSEKFDKIVSMLLDKNN